MRSKRRSSPPQRAARGRRAPAREGSLPCSRAISSRFSITTSRQLESVPWRSARPISSSQAIGERVGAERLAALALGRGRRADLVRWQPCRMADECTPRYPSFIRVPRPKSMPCARRLQSARRSGWWAQASSRVCAARRPRPPPARAIRRRALVHLLGCCKSLRVENLLLIERAELRLAPGLNVITGETGAGKTVLAHALDLLLGGRARSGDRAPGGRGGVRRGRRSTCLPSASRGARRAAARRDAQEVVLARRVGADGRTRALSERPLGGGRPTCAIVGGALLAFYGQHEHRKLTLAAAQLEILDEPCGPEQHAAAARVRGGVCARARPRGARLQELRELAGERERELDLLDFELARDRLASRLREASTSGCSARASACGARRAARGCRRGQSRRSSARRSDGPDAGEAERRSCSPRRSRADAAARRASTRARRARRAPARAPDRGAASSQRELRGYCERAGERRTRAGVDEADGSLRWTSLEERLAAIERLVRKHGGSIDAVLEFARARRARAGRARGTRRRALEGADAELGRPPAELGARAVAALRAHARLRRRASRRRCASSSPRSRWPMRASRSLSPSASPGPRGADAVEFLIAPNPGVPGGPLREIASGGELSRDHARDHERRERVRARGDARLRRGRRGDRRADRARGRRAAARARAAQRRCCASPTCRRSPRSATATSRSSRTPVASPTRTSVVAARRGRGRGGARAHAGSRRARTAARAGTRASCYARPEPRRRACERSARRAPRALLSLQMAATPNQPATGHARDLAAQLPPRTSGLPARASPGRCGRAGGRSCSSGQLVRGDIALIDHLDIDRVSAEELIAAGAAAVLNCRPSSSGAYPNLGPQLLVEAGDPARRPPRRLAVRRGRRRRAARRAGRRLARAGVRRGPAQGRAARARGGARRRARLRARPRPGAGEIDEALERFAHNTIEHMREERELLAGRIELPRFSTDLRDRPALVVARGVGHQRDLRALRPFIRDMRPVIVAVDGGADALLEAGLTPRHDRRRHGLGGRGRAALRRRARRPLLPGRARSGPRAPASGSACPSSSCPLPARARTSRC